ncbi:MAG: Ca-activated chloride channel family protein [Candidatus Krumholzibacteriia bacterium]|jgi:Ca-activated chloride channel family protein
MMEFARPFIFLLLPVVAGLVWLRVNRRDDRTVLRHSSLSLLVPHSDPLRVRLSRWIPWLSGIALLLMVVGAAGPRQSHSSEEVEGEGIDIVLSLDISGSMRSLDFEPQDRLGAAKEVIKDFIEGRPNDRVGLVVFAARAFTQCPLTLDHQVLTGFLEEVEVGLVDDGTAIGLGLATAVARLKHSTSPSRTVILLTDGVNNVLTLEPETAAKLAQSLDVRVYTVAIGREGMVPYPVNDPIFGRQTRQVETKIDLELLRRIADLTGGEMYQATDPTTLVKIFETIDALETARYETTVSTWYRERMAWFVIPALLLLLLEAGLGATWLRRVP